VSTRLWIDFSDASSLTVSTNLISQVNDKSGGGLDFLATGAERPTLTNLLNSLTVAKFDGGDVMLAESAETWKFLYDGTKYRIWIVSRTDVSNTFQTVIGIHPFDSGSYGAQYNYRGDSSVGQFAVDAGRTAGGTYFARTTSNGYYPASAWNMSGAYIDMSNATASNRVAVRLNAGTADRPNTQSASVVTNNPTLTCRLGADRTPTGTTQRYLTGSVAEIIIILGDESAATDDRVWGYLAHKWGLTANLPADHTYKSAAPTK
jgi:hypothetical protein